jgi:hypothetical protein
MQMLYTRLVVQSSSTWNKSMIPNMGVLSVVRNARPKSR